MRAKIKSLNSVALLLLLIGAALGCTAAQQFRVQPLDVSNGTPFARPIEPRQVTGPSLHEAIIRMGGRLEDTLEPE
jgi:hypothetical protein